MSIVNAARATPAAPLVPPAPAACAHCGLPVGDAGARFCCAGCAAVHGLLHSERLDRYYELRGGDGVPVPALPDPAAERAWLLPLAGASLVRLDVQGIRCAACVWLIEELFRRHAGGLRIDVNPALGTLALTLAPGFDLRAFVVDVERFGYQLGPALKPRGGGDSGLLTRLGICVALSMNAMIFAIAIYAGLEPGPLSQLVQALVFALATLAVAVGGSVFIRSAWLSVRRGLLHLDLPIALGILLAYGSSTAAYLSGLGRGVYFDTVCVFITLMLLGRFLQERVLERNRRQLLASDGVDGLLTRRRVAGRVELTRCTTLLAGDELVIAPGDLIPVDAVLLDEGAACSLDWINGESAPRAFARADVLPAGAFNAGRRSLAVRASTDFAASALVELLRTTQTRPIDAARATPWWRRFARVYVTVVLSIASATLLGWLLATGNPARALEVTAAVLIVTCPCAFGIATPLAYELTQAGLRRAGLFVRTGGFLDRAIAVRRVVFDKTGTLTTGALRLADTAPIAALDPEARHVLHNLAARSLHPKALAVLAALGDDELFDHTLVAEEIPGRGIACTVRGLRYRLGAPMWAASNSPIEADLAFGVEGRALAGVRCVEQLRDGVADELERLRGLGEDVWILSGDAPAKVRALAARVGVPEDHALGGHDPHAKAAWLAAHDHADTLMIGDGINDGLAVEQAFCSGTPAVDRPFMPARTDFYFVTPGLRPVRLALAAARALARVTRRNLAIAVAYNLVTVSLSVAGLMSPLLCAVVMPLSSLTVVLATSHSLSRRSPLWRS